MILTPLIVFLAIMYLMKDDFHPEFKFNKYDTYSAMVYSIIVQGVCNWLMTLFAIKPMPLSMTMLSTPVVPVYSVIFAPIMEELIFRKIIFGQLAKRFGFWIGSVTSSLLFAAGHFTLTGMIGYILVGIVMCYYYKKSGLCTTILAHTYMNFLVILATSLKG